ncbi:MAG TPA: phage tail protein [Kofleriaceae bacterium]|jgi:hypothetical protein
MAPNATYTAGHFELLIDGHSTTAYLRSVDGGSVKSSPVDGGHGADLFHIKQAMVTEIEPITIDFGIAGAAGVLKWIQQSWRKEADRRNGQITHADFNLDAMFEHQFYDALILETSFPTLDGSLTEAAYMKVKFLPETVDLAEASGYKIGGNMPARQKSWLPSCFRLTLEGIDGLDYVNHIDGFTIKQEVKKHYAGTERFPQIVPSSVKFPPLSCTMNAAYAKDIWKWHEKVNMKGQREHKAQTTGCLEYLAPDKTTVLFRLNLDQVRITDCKFVQANANEDKIARVKFELSVGAMDLDGDGALGLDGDVNPASQSDRT